MRRILLTLLDAVGVGVAVAVLIYEPLVIVVYLAIAAFGLGMWLIGKLIETAEATIGAIRIGGGKNGG